MPQNLSAHIVCPSAKIFLWKNASLCVFSPWYYWSHLKIFLLYEYHEKKCEHSHIPLIWNTFVRIDSPSHSCPLWKIVSRIEALQKTAKLTLPSVETEDWSIWPKPKFFPIQPGFGSLSFILNIQPLVLTKNVFFRRLKENKTMWKSK